MNSSVSVWWLLGEVICTTSSCNPCRHWVRSNEPKSCSVHSSIRSGILNSLHWRHPMCPVWQEKLEFRLCPLCGWKFGKRFHGKVDYDNSYRRKHTWCKMTFIQETFYKEGIEWPHATKLDYRCPPGKAFKQADGSSIASVTLECNWDTTWTSDPANNVQQLLPCECNNL